MQNPSVLRGKPELIGIDELGIDTMNIRRGVWDGDEELTESVRSMEIVQPLIVRPTQKDGNKKYGIVIGSRRYNAAIEAGLRKVPCIIRDMTDTEAMKLSMIENRMRKDTPVWMDIEYVGRMCEVYLKDSLTYRDAIEAVSKTGISQPTVERYFRIFKLPTEVKGLLREPNERTTRQKEYLKQFQLRENRKTLPVGHADLIAQLKGLPLERQVETALFISNKSFEVATKIVYGRRTYPTKSIDDIYEEVRGEYDQVERTIRLNKQVAQALGNACMECQMHWDMLVRKIIKAWLKTHGYL